MKEPVVIGKRVAALREEKGLEKGQLAYKVDTSSTHIGRIERNERPGVSAVLIARIAVVLDTTVEYLTGLTDDPRPIELHNRLSNDDRFTRDATHLLRRLPEHRRPEWLEHLRVACEYSPARPQLLRVAEQRAEYYAEHLTIDDLVAEAATYSVEERQELIAALIELDRSIKESEDIAM